MLTATPYCAPSTPPASRAWSSPPRRGTDVSRDTNSGGWTSSPGHPRPPKSSQARLAWDFAAAPVPGAGSVRPLSSTSLALTCWSWEAGSMGPGRRGRGVQGEWHVAAFGGGRSGWSRARQG